MNTDLSKQLEICRKELKNIRENMFKMKKNFQKDIEKIRSLATSNSESLKVANKDDNKESFEYILKPIGYIESCFKAKNGTPRQPTVCPQSKARLRILKSTFNNPEHSLLGLEEYSHIWILFIFHKNRDDKFSKAKVQPPRLNGKSIGIFSTRSPHRPNSLGLTLTQLEKIEGDTLHLIGVDLIDGTPVVDIKPYIPNYDFPQISAEENNCMQVYRNNIYSEESTTTLPNQEQKLPISNKIHNNQCTVSSVNIPSWITSPPITELNVSFSSKAEYVLNKLHNRVTHSKECEYCLEYLQEPNQVKKIIQQLLQADPRSVYRRTKCLDRLYYFTIDKLHITVWFENESEAEVLRIVSEFKISAT